jgi:hypothetical protein
MSIVTCDKAKSKTPAVVTLRASQSRSTVNESYQTPARVQTYVATQDLVVPKDALFNRIIHVLVNQMNPTKRAIRILEPGMGPAAFTRYVLRRPFTDRFDEIHVEGADISHGMLSYAAEVIEALYQSNVNGSRVTVSLSSGVNCVDANDAFYWSIKSQNKRFDAIVASQFEHYCPNSPTSPLADRYREMKVAFSTKGQFRRHCYDLLEPGGFYFSVDDRLGESPEEHEAICEAWDGHVARQFTNDAILEHLHSLNPALARNLRLNYDRKRPMSALVNVAAKAREHRRTICCEEIEPLSATRKDFVEVFGEDNIYCMMHPSIETHPGFYLMWAVKRN